MWILFNPTENDLTYEIDFAQWDIKAGETKKFPNEIADQIVHIHEFIEVVDKDEAKPKKEFRPNLKKVEEAEAKPITRDRRIVHPSSDPKIKATGGFSGEGLDDRAQGLPEGVRKEMVSGKMMSMDKDGVGWYGKGAEVDNPLAKD